MKKKVELYVFTRSFPFLKGGENTFLQYEVDNLVKEFGNIVIIPQVAEGECQKLDERIIINISLSEFLRDHRKDYVYYLRGIFSPYFFSEMHYLKVRNFRFITIKKILSFISEALLIKEWADTQPELLTGKNLLYTYWCTPLTLGLGLFKKGKNETKLVSRAHRIDLYEERGSVFCRRTTLHFLDRFYSISENGYQYIASRYPNYRNILAISRLGVKGFLKQSNDHHDGILRIVSCSSINANKQVKLIFEGIFKSAVRKKNFNYEWHHFGDGPGRGNLEIMVRANQTLNLICCIHGYVINEDLIDFYTKNQVDIFINASLSEGIPVSIMEAQSFGIPVVATNVGGIPEIVNEKVGILLTNKSLAVEKIADAINWFIENPDKVQKMRIASMNNWRENFNADKNFSAFASSLSELFK